MNKTNKIIIVIIVVIIVIGGIWWGTSRKPAPAEKEPIKIGAILPLTGSNSMYGEKEKNGLEMALAEINQKGGVNGYKLEIIYEDSQGQSKQAVDAWQKMILNKDVFLVIGTLSGICQTLSPLANQSKIVLLSSDCTVAKYTSLNDYTFRVTSSNSIEGVQMADYLLQNNIKSIAVLKIVNDYAEALYGAFEKEYTNGGGKIIITESYAPDVRDFKTSLFKIKESSAEAIYLLSYVPDAEIILKQIKELEIKSPIFAGEPIENIDLTKNAQNAEGIIYLRQEINTEKGRLFSVDYKKIYGKETPVNSARTYDALHITAEIVKQCVTEKNLNADCIKDRLYSIKNYQGVVGVINFDENGDVNIPFILKTVKNGQFVPYEK